MNIYIGEPKTITISDMQGPCPDGFHIPLDNEWSGLGNIMYGLGLSGSNHWREKLHIPRVMIRSYNDGNLTDQSYGQYWSSQLYTYGSSDDAAYCYQISNDTSSPGGSTKYVCSGLGIRPFKNEFVVPTSSWTVVNGTLGGSGIFWNQSDGIISITSNGTTGYTIADKNLGATTIYNNGDALSESNCGKLYQWGNNYGFPSSGSVTTSSTKVNASGYGPGYDKGKYYESSTFIISPSSPHFWYKTYNTNLWGGVSQGSSTKEVPQEVQNIYIGEYGWKPGANTLFYASLNGNTNSEGTLNPTFNTSSGVTYPTIGSIQYAYVNNGKMVWDIGTPPTNTITFQAWVNGISEGVVAVGATTWGASDSTGIELYFSGTQRAVYTLDNGTWYGTASNSSANTWYLVTGVKNGTTLSLYKNGTLIGSVACASSFYQKTNIIIANNSVKPVSNTSMRASNIILEDKAWSADEVLSYYNQTKSNYGL